MWLFATKKQLQVPISISLFLKTESPEGRLAEDKSMHSPLCNLCMLAWLQTTHLNSPWRGLVFSWLFATKKQLQIPISLFLKTESPEGRLAEDKSMHSPLCMLAWLQTVRQSRGHSAGMHTLELTMVKPSLCVAFCDQEAVAGSHQHQPVSEDRVARRPIGGRQIHAQPLV